MVAPVAWLWHALSGQGENPLTEGGDPVATGGSVPAPPIVYTFDDIYIQSYGLSPQIY